MESSRFLELIRTDSDRLLTVASRGWKLPVPSCPGWVAADIVRHVGEVYEHKMLCMALGCEPEGDERTPSPASDGDLAAWFVPLRDALLGELAARGPAQPSYTWFPPDQSVGFWYRRMAHETALHRYDAELALGETPAVDSSLAVDGVDEILGFLTFDYIDEPRHTGPVGRTATFACNGLDWSFTLRPGHLEPMPAGGATDARIEGPAEDLWLYLWGRHSEDSTLVTRSGDPDVLSALWARLRKETL